MRDVQRQHPFTDVAMVVLPDHLHALWRMPPADANYPMRWFLIKAAFSRHTPKKTYRKSRRNKRESGIWQRRYWEHRIRDENDLARHVDYIHYIVIWGRSKLINFLLNHGTTVVYKD